jgi:hypothetical protein
MRMRARQGGWVGLIVLLLALAIVALLGKTLLQQMGIVGGSSGDKAVVRPGNVQDDVVVPPPAAALERARGLERAVQEQARDAAAQVDRATTP